ncbi:hypothetical protein ACVWW1_004229 [Bradyrhizobium sp. JR3.5]
MQFAALFGNHGRLSISSVPLSAGRSPKIVSRISVRPLPINPARPWISPFITDKSTSDSRSFDTPDRDRTGDESNERTAAGAARDAAGANRSVPMMAFTSRFMSVSAVTNVPALAPSRSTVTRCEISNTSLSRWVT